MLIYNVFGRHLAVKKTSGEWQVFRADLAERKFSRLYDIIIPDEMTEDEIPGWLGDIFHEAASERHPDVRRMELPGTALLNSALRFQFKKKARSMD